jgi:translation initiation factor IF-3
VIGADGKQVGIMPVRRALDLAYEGGLDLIEIAPQANPPVCRIQDYGKYRFEQTKREKEARRSQKRVEIKEIRLRPKTGEHDIAVRVRAARRFLQSGAKVKVWLRFRGREVTHPEVALTLLQRIADELSDVGGVEQRATRQGRTMLMVLAPAPGKKTRAQSKKEDAEAPATRESGPDESGASESSSEALES